MTRASKEVKDLAARAASIHARLLNSAKNRGDDFNFLLNRYAIERFLYRLSISTVRDQFLLKGALLFDLWFDVPHRLTRDADFLGFGPADGAALTKSIQEICKIEADDGMAYDASTITTVEIREEANYGGLRAKLIGNLGKARSTLQLDVGYGDAVTPGPTETDLPVLLEGLPAPHLRVYPRESVVAEKVEAVVTLGIANSRMKDYFDLVALLREGRLDPKLLAEALAATFRSRKTELPATMPVGLTDEFGRDSSKQTQWRAFLRKNKLPESPLVDVVREIAAGLQQPTEEARRIATRSRT